MAIVYTGLLDIPSRLYSGSMINREQEVTWIPYVLTSDLEVISFSQEIIADTATALSSAPQSKQYIPVVTTVSGTPRYAGSFCFTSGSWYFTANNTQRYGFAFYKYPV